MLMRSFVHKLTLINKNTYVKVPFLFVNLSICRFASTKKSSSTSVVEDNGKRARTSSASDAEGTVEYRYVQKCNNFEILVV